MRRRRLLGLKLIELLVVVAIATLLAGLILSVSVRVRQQAQRTPCVANLRQLVNALQMYQQDWKVYYPLPAIFAWDRLKPYYKDKALTRCPVDPYPEGASTGGFSYYDVGRVGYNYPNYITLNPEQSLDIESRAVEEMRTRDSSHGVFACVVHGKRLPNQPLIGLAHEHYNGLVLRAQIDGAVRPVRVGYRCYSTNSGVEARRWEWYLHTDVPLPEWFGLREVECPPDVLAEHNL